MPVRGKADHNMSDLDVKPIVYRSKTKNRGVFVARVLELFGDAIRKAEKIFVKPNLVSYEPYPTTTHPDVLDVLLESLSGRDVLVGDAPAIDAGDSRRVIEAHPLKKVCDKHGVLFIDLYEKGMVTVKTERGFKLTLSKIPSQCDFVISLPVLKAHRVCDMTGALKNQFGYLDGRERRRMHTGLKDIHRSIAELNAIAKPNLSIMDAVQTLVNGQELRHRGREKPLGYMIAGADPVSVDCLALSLLRSIEPGLAGRKPEDILYIKYAIDYGVGSKDFEVEEIHC